MATPPFTHHQILALVEPFTRRGRHVDLAASNRLERRLVFKVLDHEGTAAGLPALCETLLLDNPGPDRYRLTRLLAPPGGPQASLLAEGTQPGELLARIEAVAPERQFQCGDGTLVALTHRLGTPGTAAGGNPGVAPLVLVSASAHVHGLALTLRLPAVKGVTAELALEVAPGDAIELPDDLLAVLGWHWSRLSRFGRGWHCVLRPRGNEPERSRDAEAKLRAAVEHVAQTLAEPPSRFHDRQRAARWRVTARRAFPALASVGMLGAAAALPTVDLAQDSIARMLIFHAPPLLLVAFFCMREMPRIEIPPLPRRAKGLAWRVPAAPAPAAPASHDMRTV